jgi:hypothetical protein
VDTVRASRDALDGAEKLAAGDADVIAEVW